jgi:hypothetical protein
VPSVGAAAKAAVENATRPADKAEAPAQRAPEKEAATEQPAGDKPVAAKTNS